MIKLKHFFFILILAASCSKENPKAKPTLDSFSPDRGPIGTIVTITGTNFSEITSQNLVSFNGAPAIINTATANQLVIVVPAGATTGKIKVSVNGAFGESTNSFTVFGTPTITSFSPQTGETGSLVTLAGSSFSSVLTDNLVKFGDVPATVTAATEISLTVTVPTTALSGTISVTTNGLTGVSASQFTVTPVISNVSPLTASTGSTITITGSGLKGSTAYFDGLNVTKISETATEVKVIAPYPLTSKKSVTVQIFNSNLMVTYPTLFTYINSWVRKKDFPGSSRYQMISFAIGSKAYFGLGAADSQTYLQDFWEYDPLTDNWVKKNDLVAGPRAGAFSFAAGGRGYVGVGFKKDNSTGNLIFFKDTWGYEPVSDTWAPRADFGGIGRGRAAEFVINDKGYVGAGISNGLLLNDFWEYDPSANVWTQKPDFAGTKRDFPTAFSIGTKGYMGGGDNTEFLEYDLASNQWLVKSNFPVISAFNGSEVVGFNIDNKGYMGVDKVFYQYKNQTNSWLRVDSPSSTNTKSQAEAVVVNGKAYLLIGNELWEFTPPN